MTAHKTRIDTLRSAGHYQGYEQQAKREKVRKEALGMNEQVCVICGTTMTPGRRVCPGCGRKDETNL